MKLSLFVQPAHRPGRPSLVEELHAFNSRPLRCRCADLKVAAHSAAVEPEHATRAEHATAIAAGNGTVPEWVELLPAGIFTGVDGRGPYQVREIAACIAASKERAGPLNGLPIDYGHRMESALFGAAAMGAEAAGWIVDLEERSGAIYGKVEWTAAAAEKIKNREFRGLSPVFYHDTEGVVLWIARAGLTNTPNLRIKSLNSQQQDSQHQETGVTPEMKALLARMAAIFGLPADSANEDAIIARCSAAAEAEGTMTKVVHSMSLPKTATGEDVIQAIQAVQTPDPAKFVAMAQFSAVSDKLATMVKAEGERVVNAAKDAGKITPGQVEHFMAWHSRDPEGAKAFLEKAVPVVKPGSEITGQQPATGEPKIDAAGKAICSSLGIAEADYLKNLDQEQR